VRLLAGTRLHRIPALLAPHGLAMANLGDIDRQSIAGALSTGTHGTGLGHGGLATQVVGATLVTADGELLTVDDENEPDLLPAVALGLGALGILVDVTLQCVPAFALGAQEQPEPRRRRGRPRCARPRRRPLRVLLVSAHRLSP
jgi:FAD/FMN-containing dehydrogenase